MLFLSIFTIYSFCILSVSGRLVDFSILKWLNEIQSNGYDRLIIPGSLEGEVGTTTNVGIEIYVEHIGNFRQTAMDYAMDVFFIEHWTDPRLKHDRKKSLIFSDKAQVDRLWIPDIYFSNSKSAQYNTIMVPNMNFRVWPNGQVRMGTRTLGEIKNIHFLIYMESDRSANLYTWYYALYETLAVFFDRISLILSCHMDLSAYPLDRQVCPLKIQTLAADNSLVNVTWFSDSPISFDPQIKFGDLDLRNTKVETCNASYYNYSYSCLLANFYLQRSFTYSLLQTYIPTTFIVIISWISFYIDPTSVPGRVALSVTTLLTLSTQAIAMQFHLPPISYANAQHYWFGLCLLFLFLALVEFAVVNTFSRLEEHHKRMVDTNANKTEAIPLNETSSDQNVFPTKQKPVGSYRSMALMVDRCSRVIFPIAFAIFCTVYWWYYGSGRYLGTNFVS